MLLIKVTEGVSDFMFIPGLMVGVCVSSAFITV